MIFKSFRYLAAVVMLISTLRYLSGSEKCEKETYDQGSCKCGITKENSKGGYTRITHGVNVTPSDKYPWMVSITAAVDGNCGGALISPRVILTAAHCFQRKDDLSDMEKSTCAKSNWTGDICWFGPSNINISFDRNDQNTAAVNSSVVKLIIHEHYIASGLKADIALVILKDPVPCSDSSRPICLPKKPIAKSGLTVIVAGMGYTKGETESPALQLQEGMMTICRSPECHSEPEFRDADLDGTLCLSSYKQQSACMGDSGGPMFIEDSGVFYHLGIASMHSSLICEPDKHASFTDTYYYMDWIKSLLFQYC